MDDKARNEYQDYAWKHFTVIADQRLKTFNFYIIMLAGLMAATAAGIDKANRFWTLIPCGIFHIICSFIFYLIDERSRRLVELPKQVLIQIEESRGWELFRKDAIRQQGRWNQISSYTMAFRIAFGCQCIVGLLVICLAFTTKHPASSSLPSTQQTQSSKP